jgi:regulator of sigma E protease
VSNGEDVSRLIQAAAGGPVEFRIRREREVETVTIVPAFDDAEARYLVGAYFLPITFTNEIKTVAPGSSLSLAGLRAGDRIVAIDGEGTATGVGIVNRLDRLLPLASVSLRVERKGEAFDVAVPAVSLTVDRLLAGVSFADLGVESRRPGLLAGLVLGAGQFAEHFNFMVGAIQGILSGRIAASEAVSGPIGIARVLGEGVAQGPSVFLRLFSFLSLSLGLFNLIPFPALDGSRAAFALYELIRRRRIPPEREGMIHAIGFLILIGLMILVTYQDILKLFR